MILQIPRMKLHIQHTEDAKATLVIGNRNFVIEHFGDEGRSVIRNNTQRTLLLMIYIFKPVGV